MNWRRAGPGRHNVYPIRRRLEGVGRAPSAERLAAPSAARQKFRRWITGERHVAPEGRAKKKEGRGAAKSLARGWRVLAPSGARQPRAKLLASGTSPKPCDLGGWDFGALRVGRSDDLERCQSGKSSTTTGVVLSVRSPQHATERSLRSTHTCRPPAVLASARSTTLSRLRTT